MVKARYIAYYYNKMFYAGVDGAMSTVYWSKYLDPANIPVFNYANINAQDGDVITGLQVTSDNKLKIYKKRSIWEMYPSGIADDGETNFDFRMLSQSIGCIYGTTIDELDGRPIFVSARGVELYDGTFNLISAPIDNYIKNLRQMHIGSSIITQDTADDWGAGSGTNIDTTTYSGSVAIKNSIICPGFTLSNWSAVTGTNIDTTSYVGKIAVLNTTIPSNYVSALYIDSPRNYGFGSTLWTKIKQSLIFNQNLSITGVSLILSKDSDSGNWAGNISIGIIDYNGNTIASCSGAIAALQAYDNYSFATYTFTSPANVSSGTYSIQIVPDNDNRYINVGTRGGAVGVPTGQDGATKIYTSGEWKTWKDRNFCFSLNVNTITANFTSQALMATNWSTWGAFTKSDIIPAGSSVTYYAKTAIDQASLTSATTFSIIDNSLINSTTGPWLQFYSEMSFPAGGSTPIISTMSINSIGMDTASYITQNLNAGTSWGSWTDFKADETKPTGSSINYYAITSTSSYNLSTNTAFPLTNNAPIPSTVGPYIKVISSFTRTDEIAAPMVNKYPITSLETDNNVMVGKVYDGRYHLFVSTDNTTKINNVDLVYQKTGEWTIFNDIYASATCIYNDYFYTGDSRDNGQVYKMFIKDTYNDNGGAYDAYWCSKVFDFGVFTNEKLFDSMWISAKNSGNWNLYVDYRLDGTINNWTTKSISLYNTYGEIVQKIPFAMSEPKQGRYIQYRIRNSNANEHFRFKKIQNVFEVLPTL
jgi:hypothetical protein